MLSVSCRIIKYFAVVITLLVLPSAGARAVTWQSLDVTVAGIEAKRGGQLQVFVFLEDGFPIKHAKALKTYVKPISGGEMTIKMEVPANIPFALKVHHDEDGNNKVTKNWTGIFPKEGLGFSAGAKMSPMPPTFGEAKMTPPPDNATSVKIRYP